MPEPNEAKSDKANWAYQPEDGPASEQPEQPSEANQPQQAVSWTASEFVDVQKGAGWHVLFFAGAVLISVLLFIFMHDFVAPIMIILASVIFVIISSKKPRDLPYELNDQGIQIGARFYRYDNFKSFDLASEGGIKSINLLPLHRFMPELSMYFPPDQEGAILDLLSLHLPHEERAEKAMDKIARKLRF